MNGSKSAMTGTLKQLELAGAFSLPLSLDCPFLTQTEGAKITSRGVKPPFAPLRCRVRGYMGFIGVILHDFWAFDSKLFKEVNRAYNFA